MSGIYLHIPFCKKACTYCDFHFSTSSATRSRVLGVMAREMEERAPAWGDRPLGSIYLGGGTPSILDASELRALFGKIRSLFTLDPEAEVTLEANPDDITAARLEMWKELGITRLSIGVQSFRDDRLKAMGRAHNAEEAVRALELIAKAGFSSWTLDLIYGLPGMGLKEWDEQLATAFSFGAPHLSAYCLTVEPRTVLAHQVQKGSVQMPPDELSASQFDLVMDRTAEAGMVHYEISNFGLPDHFGRHNMSYWEGTPYLGIGPSAHSFDGRKRRWNVANNVRYAEGIEAGERYWEEEEPDRKERTNELILTGLRRLEGLRLDQLPIDIMQVHSDIIMRYVDRGELELQNGRIALTRAGKHIADRIASDLFLINDR